MKLRVLFAAALLCAAHTAGAVRVLKQLERPFELSVSELNLPSDATGTLTFKPCDDCRSEIRRLSAGTEFLLNGRAVDFGTFREIVGTLRGAAATASHPASVFVDAETGRVTRLSIYKR